MKYEEWIRYEEDRLAEQHRSVQKKGGGLGAQMMANYRERHLVEVLLQQQALIDALKAQIASLAPGKL
jgi:hypothetical protein